ncbi:hypothetical protein CNR22_10850 [Sphingobacteriaceae bacterium]|nr:hypothetical protein CNR22_10850 [Sphingobacteriaceae bacterium]
MKKLKLLLFFVTAALNMLAQEKPKKMPDFFRKEEIIYDNKRYRIHNCYLTLGPGFLQTSIRKEVQRTIALDFQFPIRRHHFQAGVQMSGESFGSNNNIQGHVCYGWRKEKTRNNLAAYVGPSVYTGVETGSMGEAVFYQGLGLYGCVQAVTKLAYDIGIGAELFGDISPKQGMVGLKLIVFFSGAYRGPKKNVNINVRSENP